MIMKITNTIYPATSILNSFTTSSIFIDLNLCEGITISYPVGTTGSHIQFSSFLSWHSAKNIVDSDASDRSEDPIGIIYLLVGKSLKDVTRTSP
jgi:hypothetical protein